MTRKSSRNCRCIKQTLLFNKPLITTYTEYAATCLQEQNRKKDSNRKPARLSSRSRSRSRQRNTYSSNNNKSERPNASLPQEPCPDPSDGAWVENRGVCVPRNSRPLDRVGLQVSRHQRYHICHHDGRISTSVSYLEDRHDWFYYTSTPDDILRTHSNLSSW